MSTYPVELYIYELSPESQLWCKEEFLQVLPTEECILHTSVVVHGVEYSYGEHGIESQKPKLRPLYDDDDFEEAVSRIKNVGKTVLNPLQVQAKVKSLKNNTTWLPYKFNAIEHNCHHFSDMLVKLLCGEEVVLPFEVYDFNKQLLSYRDSWIDEFFVEEQFNGS